MSEKRKSARAPILTQVEAQGERFTALGRTQNISVGGLLIETPDTLPVSTAVIVRFFLPRESQPLEAAGRVSRTDPGKSMAVSFLGLPKEQEEKILDYIGQLQGPPAAAIPGVASQRCSLLRRSTRLPHHVAVILTWTPKGGNSRQQAAELVNLSRHGVFVHSFSELYAGQVLHMAVPEIDKETPARVVRVAAVPVPGRVGLALEFLGTEDFWEKDIPSDRLPEPEGPKIARRRSARLPRRIDVFLNWIDDVGKTQEEKGETCEISEHGAAVSSPRKLSLGQRCRFRVPLVGREIESHVVWAREPEHSPAASLGVEFLQIGDFWGGRFPPDPGVPAG